jgi:hypothetical protein
MKATKATANLVTRDNFPEFCRMEIHVITSLEAIITERKKGKAISNHRMLLVKIFRLALKV